MEFKIYKVESDKHGFAGYELIVLGEHYCVFSDQSFLKGLRIGSIVAGLDEELTRTLIFDASAEQK